MQYWLICICGSLMMQHYIDLINTSQNFIWSVALIKYMSTMLQEKTLPKSFKCYSNKKCLINCLFFTLRRNTVLTYMFTRNLNGFIFVLAFRGWATEWEEAWLQSRPELLSLEVRSHCPNFYLIIINIINYVSAGNRSSAFLSFTLYILLQLLVNLCWNTLSRHQES